MLAAVTTLLALSRIPARIGVVADATTASVAVGAVGAALVRLAATWDTNRSR